MLKKMIIKDERSEAIYYRIGSRMYGITLLSLMLAVNYRRYTLGQSISEYRDILFIFFGTGIPYLAANLYYGGILPVRFKKIIIRVFSGLALISLIVGYSSGKITSLEEAVVNLFYVLITVAVIAAIYYFFIFLGRKKDEEE